MQQSITGSVQPGKQCEFPCTLSASCAVGSGSVTGQPHKLSEEGSVFVRASNASFVEFVCKSTGLPWSKSSTAFTASLCKDDSCSTFHNMPEPQFSGDRLSWNSERKLIAPTTAKHAGEATTGFFLRLAHLPSAFHAANSGSEVTCTLRATAELAEPAVVYNTIIKILLYAVKLSAAAAAAILLYAVSIKILSS
jgi:hypothetical protein